ncbi:MAG: 2-(S)-hydroxypropyl-CoM dehydrogenase [Alphaproteobacteria bacterium MarineAlpha5_Bin9]|nr:MAG: 2-(S)-hydroxypropyl-CoM dehydrogenase [Alphaproteobacteria bacterium MarineAlpha5_Bin9]|tara:strand:- start:9714 stop:10502 length:789 start_codon:yes stop_codon:yes gene_type:complete
MSNKVLNNKNIVISAAAEGIGWSIAKKCLDNGAKVFVSDKNKDAINIIKNQKKYKKNLYTKVLDANNYREVEKYFLFIKHHIKKIDGLINNVGIAGPTSKIENIKINDWRETIDTNINSHFYFTKFATSLLKKKSGGSIINVSSTAGLYGFPYRSPYAATKWAIIGITKTLAMEMGKHNIRVNAICPGSVEGNRMKRVIRAKSKISGLSYKSIKKDLESMVSLNSFVSKEDISNMAFFLLTDEAKKISGQIMTVDGNTEKMN